MIKELIRLYAEQETWRQNRNSAVETKHVQKGKFKDFIYKPGGFRTKRMILEIENILAR